MAVYTIAEYPKTVTLRDGAGLRVRPMEPGDADALLDFFRRLPEADRHFLKEDVTSPMVIRRWADQLDYDRALPLLAFDDGRVVADAVLLTTRARSRAHVGEVRVAVDPAFRNRGLGSRLLRELADVAQARGLARLAFELVADREEDAVNAAERLGFVREATLHDFACDPDGHPHDVVVMVLPLGKWWEWWQY